MRSGMQGTSGPQERRPSFVAGRLTIVWSRFINLQRVLPAMVSPAYRGAGMAEQTCWEETVWQVPAFRRTPRRRGDGSHFFGKEIARVVSAGSVLPPPNNT